MSTLKYVPLSCFGLVSLFAGIVNASSAMGEESAHPPANVIGYFTFANDGNSAIVSDGWTMTWGDSEPGYREITGDANHQCYHTIVPLINTPPNPVAICGWVKVVSTCPPKLLMATPTCDLNMPGDSPFNLVLFGN